MDSISLKDLPDSYARAVQAMVDTLRRQLRIEAMPQTQVQLPKWPGTVTGSLRREDIYSDDL